MIDLHSIGIVVIGRNEGQRLRDSLAKLLELGYRDNTIYVDSGSTDGSVEFARSIEVDVVGLDMSLPFTAARARNVGFQRLMEKHPTTRFVQFLDGDCVMHNHWMESALSTFESDSNVAVVCGRLRERFPERSFYNRLIDHEWNTAIGQVAACGGIAMYDARRFVQEAGFNATMIAGEEPELCHRLRRAGGVILRIDAEMALHDADIHHFSQWWRRAKRFGHAAAEAKVRFGDAEEVQVNRQFYSILIWGAAIPLLCLVLLVLDWRLCLIGLLVYIIQWLRLSRRFARLDSWAFAARRAATLLVCKFAEFQGVTRFFVKHTTGCKPALIEYKS